VPSLRPSATSVLHIDPRRDRSLAGPARAHCLTLVPGMIHPMGPQDVQTFREVRDNRYRLYCWCTGCKKVVRLDPALLVSLGYGDRRYRTQPAKCRACGSPGRWFVTDAVRQPDPFGPGCTVLAFPFRRPVLPPPTR
jgi:hypothetical protein